MMTVLRKIIENSASSITIALPQEYINKKIEILIMPYEEEADQTPKSKYDLSKFFGKIKWTGDALAVQKKLRDEWD